MELRIELEEKDVAEDEVERQIADLRARLTSMNANQGLKSLGGYSRKEAKALRPSDTHAWGAAKASETENLSRALGIRQGYQEGDAFDRELQERQKLERIEERRRRDQERIEAAKERERAFKKRREEERQPTDMDDRTARRRGYAPPPGRRSDGDMERSRKRRVGSRSRSPPRRRRDSYTPSPPPRRRRDSYTPSPSPPPRKRRDSYSLSPPPKRDASYTPSPPAKRRQKSLTPSPPRESPPLPGGRSPKASVAAEEPPSRILPPGPPPGPPPTRPPGL